MKAQYLRIASSTGRRAGRASALSRASVATTLAAVLVSTVLLSSSCAAADPTAWLSSAWSATTSATKKGWNTTVDVVTLKPIRKSFSKPSPPKNEMRLGMRTDPRKTASKSSPGMLGSLFAPKPTPKNSQTLEEFFAQDRPK